MPTDNVTLNSGSGGATIRTFADSSGTEWPAAALCYFTTVSPGANVLAEVTPSAGLPVAQQGAWNIGTLTSITDTVAISGIVAVSGSVAVTGTFWQATQPVSIAASVTVAQATAASLNATVVGTGTFAVQASQSGIWDIGTVTTVTTVGAVTAITNALPAGTNLIGSIAEAPQIAAAFAGTTATTVQYANFSTSSSGATTIVAGISGKKIYVIRWKVSANGNTNVNLQSHTTTSLATGIDYLTQYARGGGAYCPLGVMATATGEALDVNNSAAIAISGELTYVAF